MREIIIIFMALAVILCSFNIFIIIREIKREEKIKPVNEIIKEVHIKEPVPNPVKYQPKIINKSKVNNKKVRIAVRYGEMNKEYELVFNRNNERKEQ